MRKELHHSAGRDANTVDLSPAKFLKYLDSDSVKDPNYIFMVDIAFEIIDAMFLHRKGLRCGRAELIWAARAKFSKVWFSRNHPMYRELDIQACSQRLQIPPELNSLPGTH